MDVIFFVYVDLWIIVPGIGPDATQSFVLSFVPAHFFCADGPEDYSYPRIFCADGMHIFCAV